MNGKIEEATAAVKETADGRYVKAKELAGMLDVSVVRIGQLRKEGVLRQEQTPAGARYPLAESVKAYVRFLRESKNGGAKTTKTVLEEQKTEAEISLKSAKARIAELELGELLGKFHRAEDVEAMTTDFVLNVRSLLTALTGRLAVEVVRARSAAEASAIIRDEVRKILAELSDYRYDPAEYARRVSERAGMSGGDPDDDAEDEE